MQETHLHRWGMTIGPFPAPATRNIDVIDNRNVDKLKELLARCKCGVFLTVNEHRDYYKTAAEQLETLAGRECPPELAADVRAKMIATDTIIELQFYPDTPIGSYSICHHDLDAALDEALTCLTASLSYGRKAP